MNFSFKPSDNENEGIEKYGRNLNDEIKLNKIDPIIGRDDEIKRLIEIISRKTKNNPVLIGDPGVGKTAIVEGLAQRIINGDVPENLKDKIIYEISIPNLVAGSAFQGQFEEKLNTLIKKVKDSNGQIILFIDEIHQLIGAGRTGNNGAMDAANILKPPMARGEIKIIGATTLNEYREYIEKDQALERRMQKILVREPTIQETLTILRGLKERWELFHKVKIYDSALIAAVNLSTRYIPDKFLPDKAIDLIDEAAAKVKTEIHSTPSNLENIKRQIIHLKTERASLINDDEEKSKKRMVTINKELVELEKIYKEEEHIWIAQKTEHDKLINLKKELDDCKQRVELLQYKGEFEKASKILYVTIPNLKKEINKYEEKNIFTKDSVTANEIADVISKTTGIPLSKITEFEKEKLLLLSDKLKKIVMGQNQAIDIVANAILRNKAGINDPNRPIGSFLFLGPTGVGKTFLSKAIANELFHSKKTMIRFDMSEYMEKHSISKLLGAPPGYIGFEQPGALTEEVRRQPYSVLLFDEIEKAHPDILNLLLQILDDGHLRDSRGRLINFKNTLIIMTSNIGSQNILENRNDDALKEIKQYLKPELFNRIDEIIIFNPINNIVIKEIIRKQLDELIERLKIQDYEISYSELIINKIRNEGFDQTYGARPLKRYIQKNIENILANEILANKIKKNKEYIITVDKTKKIVIAEKKKN